MLPLSTHLFSNWSISFKSLHTKPCVPDLCPTLINVGTEYDVFDVGQTTE